ncbi:hypothetical protein KKD20_06880 [Patescibacteria group bacterium]|nr:hypothetical protein [Candidatus Omnitrophota bacterium]MBU4332798.1 hypothetical protein [Patescibacteria group bacterium]
MTNAIRLPAGKAGNTQYAQRNKAQSTLEITVALIAVFILFLGSVKIFVWVNERMVLRQEAYEKTRVSAGSSNFEVQVDESDFPKLDIFGENAQ